MPANSAIVAQQLVKHFAPNIKAVNGIDLDIPEGQVFGFLGQNGSGKTTTVRILTTLLKPTSGRAFVAGYDVLRQPVQVRRATGVALQEVGLDEIQTGREILTLQAQLFGLRGAAVRRRVEQLLEVVGLTNAADRRVKGYSGGMQRRLDLAAALVHNPRIIFLDEPTTGLDPASRESVWRYVRQLNESQGVTIFLTTQYLEEADRLAHRLAIMDAGQIVAEGSPEELKAAFGTDVITIVPGRVEDLDRGAEIVRSLEGVEEALAVDNKLLLYLREGARAIPRIAVMMEEADVPVAEITLARPTLDDVFLHKTGHQMEHGSPLPADQGGRP